MDRKNTGVAGRTVGLLASGVVLLAIALIVLIACSTYVIQQRDECETTEVTNVPYKDTSEEFEHQTHENGTLLDEHIIVYTESRREFSVNRDSKTGYVTSVLFLDYKKGITVLYGAKDHSCYMYADTDGDLDDDLSNLRNPLYESDETVSYTIGELVDDSSKLPTEMAPFCSTTNSYWLSVPDNSLEDRQKRSTEEVYYCCCRYFCHWYPCYYVCGCYYEHPYYGYDCYVSYYSSSSSSEHSG